MYLGYIHKTGDNIFPQILFRTREVITDTPINAFFSPYNMEIKSMVADTQFGQFSNLEYDNSDKFLIDFAPKNIVVVIPLTAFIMPNSIDAPYIANDLSMLSKVYEGFLVKYYPMLSENMFKLYLLNIMENFNSQEIINKIQNVLENETELMNVLTSVKYSSMDSTELMKEIDINVINADISTKPKIDNNLLLRNIFDKLHVQNTKDVNITHMYYEMTISPHLIGMFLNKDIKISITKYKQNGIIPKMTNELIKYISKNNLLTITVTGTMRTVRNNPMMIFMNSNGEWTIRTVWDEKINIDQIMAKTQKLTDHVIDLINNNIIYYGRDNIVKINKSNSEIKNISLILIYHHILTIPEFKFMRQNFNQFIESNMANYTSAVNFEVNWIKGVLKPCTIKVYYSTANIKFEIINSTLRDLANLLPILNIYVLNSMEKIKQSGNKYKKRQDNNGEVDIDDDYSNVKTIKKLRETDPKLYDNLKTGMIYSKKCQGIKQPEVFIESELKNLSAQERKELIKYWNFTYNKPAYYRCQKSNNGERLEFSFLTGLNINDYCVPCCKIKETKKDSNKDKMQNKCLSEHKYTDKYYNLNPSTYVFIANKALPSERIGSLPKSIAEIFDFTPTNKYDGYFTYGTEQVIQSMPNSSASIVYAITHALEISVKEFILDIINNLKTKNVGQTDMQIKRSLRHPQKKLYGGYSQEYIHGLIDALMAIFVNNVDFYNFNMRNWDEFFIYQTLEIYNINIILFRIKTNEILIMDNNAPKLFILQYDFDVRIYSVLESEIAFYPIYFINIKDFINNGIIKQKIFNNEIENINKQIITRDTMNLTEIIKMRNKVTELFVNKNNRVYAIIIEDDNESVYLPISFSHIYPKIKLNYDVFIPQNVSFALLLKYIEKFKYILTAYITYKGNVIALEINRMNAYIVPFPKSELSADIRDKYPEKESLVDLIQVNIAIAKNQSPKEEYFDLMFETYYENYLYDIIKIEIINLIDNGKINPKEIYKLTVNDLEQLIPHKVENKPKLTSNIVMPCSSSVKMSHCTGEHELIVPNNFREYLEIVLVEMNDKYRNFVKNTKKNIVINMLNFEQTFGEIIDWKIIQ